MFANHSVRDLVPRVTAAFLIGADSAVLFVAGGVKVEENRRFESPIAAVRRSVSLGRVHGSICSFIL